MEWYNWVLAAVLAVVLILLGLSLTCFYLVFVSPRKKSSDNEDFGIPKGDIYDEFHDEIVAWIKMTRGMDCENFSIKSHDGLTLRARYFECNPDGPVELLFHGYHGNSERDLSGGVERCFALGRNAVIIDQRGCGESDGRVITFGIREHLDCVAWANFAAERFGKDKKIILTGVSMGAATVMMAAAKPLPENVVCVLADCGYTSPKEIICKVLRDIGLPTKIFYPLIRFGAILYGRFDIESYSPEEAMKKCSIPMLFIHGDTDGFVPSYMSERLHEICTSEKKSIRLISSAGHGLAYPKDKEGYLEFLREAETNFKFL